MKKIKILILAAGKGVRMQSELPKALMPVKGKAMVRWLLEAVEKSGVDSRPIVIVGHQKENVIAELGDNPDYVEQKEQLGTGHAVMSAKERLKDQAENIMVLPSDHPFVSAATIRTLAEKHIHSGSTITMATIKLPDFEDWKAGFYKSFSRIVRDANGQILKDVQVKDASEEEKKITEVNPIYFCFKANWLWKNIQSLRTDNAQKEYYLTDLIRLAIQNGETIESVNIDPKEGLAANSKEELEVLEKFAV